jgi:hypothetical protein
MLVFSVRMAIMEIREEYDSKDFAHLEKSHR